MVGFIGAITRTIGPGREHDTKLDQGHDRAMEVQEAPKVSSGVLPVEEPHGQPANQETGAVRAVQ